MQLSVIILNYNVRLFLEQCVLSVERAIQSIDAEIIVVDNNSQDGSCTMIREKFPNVLLIENAGNTGFPKGNNIGVTVAKGKYLCILNPDTVVAEDTFIKALSFAESLKECGIIGVKLIDGTGNFLPESKRGVPTPFVALSKMAGLYKIFPKSKFVNKYYAGHLSQDQSGKVDILVGAFMLLERSLYNEVGGFDEKCFMYSDDIDLSYMVLKTGRANYYFSGTTVVHYKGESTIRDSQYIKRFREAMNFFYKKHFGSVIFFDLFLRAGSFFFALAKSAKRVHIINPERIILISQDAVLASEIEKAMNRKIEITEIPIPLSTPARFIFDGEAFSSAYIMSEMQRLKNAGVSFRIAYRSRGFVIGSDSSDNRGEVLLLPLNR